MMLLFDKSKHGAAVTISSDGICARRTTGFANGIVLSNRPLNTFDKVTFELHQHPSSIWRGSLRVGVLASQQLPTAELPLSTMEPTAATCYSMVSLDKLVSLHTGMRVTVWLTQNRSLHYAINNILRGTLIDNHEIDENNNGFLSLRLALDLFGNTIKVQLIRDDDTVPLEIKARGPDAIRHFQTACDTGTTIVRRTLLLIVGPKASGKTRLKNVLVTDNNDNDSDDSSVDLSSSCSINIDQSHVWSLSKSNNHNPSSTIIQDLDDNENSRLVVQQHEYESQLVHNIVLDLLKRRYELYSVHDKKDKNWKETLIEDLKLVYPSSVVSLSVRSLVEKYVHQMKSTDPHGILVKLTANGGNRDEQKPQQQSEQLRLDIWDMPGSASSCCITHQIFLSSRAIYLLVFDLTKDLDQLTDSNKELTNLDHLNFIMHSVYSHSANNSKRSIDDEDATLERLSPPIILIGTHRNSFTTPNKITVIENQLAKIRSMISKKPYCKHVVEPYFVVDTFCPDDIDHNQIDQLKRLIEDVSLAESYIGEQQPTKWLQFENDLNRLKKQQDNFYASLDQICEIARTQNICSSDELKTLLDFYHDLGVIVYFGNTQDMFLKNTLILRPQKLIRLIRRLVYSDGEDRENDDGILDERTFESLCQPFIEQKQSLLALLKKFDLLCERPSVSPPVASSPSTTITATVTCKQFIVPGRIRRMYNDKPVTEKDEQAVTLYYVFDGYFPESLFHQILVRTIKWTQSTNVTSPKLYYRRGKFVLDDQHLLILTASSMKYARMKVQIIRNWNNNSTMSNNSNNRDDSILQLAEPTIVAKVRKFLESLLNEIKSTWIRRLAFQCMVLCPCGKICDFHKAPYCSNNFCLHFLNLDHCLSNPFVECSFRRVSTLQYRNWFPKLSNARAAPVIDILFDQKSMNHFFEDANLPGWIRSTAKLLGSPVTTTTAGETTSWILLAKQLGYQQPVIDQFSLNRNPSLQLITDWIVRSGNSSLAVDMLLATMKHIGRDDLVEIISHERDAQNPLPSVFISYQWDVQEEVKELRNFLELVGFTCWMDLGQIGGGELLYEKIDHGIRNAKVIICCVTPMYIVSTMCQRELILADMLKKPIVPVMFESVPWPPLGPASLILSQLTYVDLKGAGGHGGNGKTADLQARYSEIASVVARHTASSSLSTFHQLMHSSSREQRGGQPLAAVNASRQAKLARNRRRHNTESLNSNESSSNSSMSEDDIDYDDYGTDNSDRRAQPIEPILTNAHVASTTIGAPISQPFQIRNSVHLEHRLGPLANNNLQGQPQQTDSHIAHCTVCSIL